MILIVFLDISYRKTIQIKKNTKYVNRVTFVIAGTNRRNVQSKAKVKVTVDTRGWLLM